MISISMLPKYVDLANEKCISQDINNNGLRWKIDKEETAADEEFHFRTGPRRAYKGACVPRFQDSSHA